MTIRTIYDLPLDVGDEALNPLTVRALRRIVEKHGQTVTFDVIIDGMFGVGSATRRGVIQHRITIVRSELAALCDRNPTLIESGNLGVVQTFGYRLTPKALALREGADEDVYKRSD